MKGSDRASTRLGRCSGGASFPAGHSWLCPGLQEEIQVSVVPVWFIHLQPRHSFGIPSNIPWLSCELREQGAREGRGAHPSPGPSSVPRSSSALWITTRVKNLKTSSSSQLGVAAPGPGLAVPKGMAAGGSGKRELEGLDAQCSASTSALLLVPFAAGSWSSSLAVPHGSTLLWVQPFPFPGMWIFPRNLAVPLEVREAAGILLVVVGNGEDGVIELVVTELLERHSGRDGGEHRDI